MLPQAAAAAALAAADLEVARQMGSTAGSEVSEREHQLTEPKFTADAKGTESMGGANKFLVKLSMSTGRQERCEALTSHDLQTYIKSQLGPYGDAPKLPRIGCRGDEITAVTLAGEKLTSLPDEIGDLSHLQVMDLSSNHLDRLPQGIAKLENLRVLSLASNKLKSLPVVIAKLKNLKVLSLSNMECPEDLCNELTSLPDDIGSLQSLEVLDVTESGPATGGAGVIPNSHSHFQIACCRKQFES